MPQDRMMQSIGRIERALARLEGAGLANAHTLPDNGDLQRRYDRLRAETQAAVGAMDALLNQGKA